MEIQTIKKLLILTGTHHPELAEAVAKHIGVKVSPVSLQRFANGEVRCQIEESVRGGDVFIFQSHNASVNDAIMEQAVLIDAAKRASARRITAVCPFLGYSRQDRKAAGREPISARLVIDFLAAAGADRIVSVNLHSGQTQGFFDGPFDHLTALPALTDHIKRKFSDEKLVVVSPDAGRVKLADRYAKHLGADLAIVHKRRNSSGEAEALNVIGEVKDRHCVVIDDMIDTAGTICQAADLLKKEGAKAVTAATTHGIFSSPAEERLRDSSIDYLIITNTLPLSIKLDKPEIEVVSITPLLASAVKAIFEESSVSAIFGGDNQI